MFLVKSKSLCLFLVIASFVLVSTPTFSASKEESQPKDVCSQNQKDDKAPTVENMLKARQEGDLEKADRIQAILNEKAKKSWRSPGGDEIVVESPCPTAPECDNAFYKSYLWDGDHLICTGPVSGGISVDYDTSGNVYAVRCSTWNGIANACIKVYKYQYIYPGYQWSVLTSFSSVNSFSYPVVLTGSTGNKLYLFYLSSSQNGDIWMTRFTQSGVFEGSYEVKVGADTITYFSACVDYENGNHLMVAYQKERPSDPTPDLYTITSADYGETWDNEVFVSYDGAHPDIAYGRNGYVYLVFEFTGGLNHEILFYKNSDYCSPGGWVELKFLTHGSHHTYPKVAALHTLPADSPYVWVAYNQENPAGTDIDLLYAYSRNGFASWYPDCILDSSSAWNEMACDLWTKRSPDYQYVHICYFAGRYVYPIPHGHIFYGSASATNPENWGFLFGISNAWPTQSEDGRKICQGTFAQGNCAIMYAGKDPNEPFGDNFQHLYFDASAWPTDVEEEVTEGEVPAEFSLSANYPNPFNPVTRIQYTVGSEQTQPIHATLKIYNLLGQLVKTLVNEPKEPGTYEVIWDGRDERGDKVSSGVYFYMLEAEDLTRTKRMVLLK